MMLIPTLFAVPFITTSPLSKLWLEKLSVAAVPRIFPGVIAAELATSVFVIVPFTISDVATEPGARWSAVMLLLWTETIVPATCNGALALRTPLSGSQVTVPVLEISRIELPAVQPVETRRCR